MFEVEIAGICLSVDAGALKAIDPFTANIMPPEGYERFVTSCSEDACIEFKVLDCKIHPDRSYKYYFDSSGLWELHYNNRNEFMVNLKNGAYRQSLAYVEVNLNERKGNIFYSEAGIKEIGNKLLLFAYPVSEITFVNLLPSFNGVLVHACGINDNGKGVLFLGTSGSGKSTTTRLWMDEKGVKVLSDDRIVIREIDDKSYAYGTPWHGEVNICDPGRVEINKIFFIEHSDKNCLKPLSHIDAATRMLVRSFPTFWDKEGMELTLSLIDRIVKKVSCYEFGFVPDKSAVDFIRDME